MILQSEILWIGIVAIITSIVIFLSIYYSSIISEKTQEMFRSATFDDLVLKSLANLYISKPDVIEKTTLQIAIDGLSYLKKYRKSIEGKEQELGEIAYYGIALGSYKASDLINPIFDETIGKERWQLIICNNTKNLNADNCYIYGNKEKLVKEVSKIRSYVLPIPIPDGEVGVLVLRVV